MADAVFTTSPFIFGDNAFNGGLNTSAGPFALANSESSDLQNIDFDIFGSIVSRNGYVNLSTASLTTAASDGLHYFEYESSGSTSRKLLNCVGGKLYKMDEGGDGEPDSNWDDITDGQTITSDNPCDFVTWRNKCFITNGYNTPLKYDGSSLTTATLPANVTRPKFIEQMQNFLFYLNVYVSGTKEGSRFYWSDLNDETTWDAASFIRVSDNDGTEIMGGKVLSDRLVIFKERTIHNVFATFDPDIPFTVQKSNSSVGCVAPYSIQDVQNNIVFLSQDGFYVYDGSSSTKISDKITATIRTHNLSTARSAVYQDKNLYLCSMLDQDGTYTVFVWNYALNAWSVYEGWTVSAMCKAFVNGREERIYFADNAGWAYRADYGSSDYPLSVETSINKYYYTNWRPFEDLITQKSVPHAILYHRYSDCSLEFAWSFDFEDGDQYSEIRSLEAPGGMVWDVDDWDDAEWANVGGATQRFHLIGRGRVVRFGFKNNTKGESFRIDGLGLMVRGETNR